MKIKRVIHILSVLLFLLAVIGCQQEQETAQAEGVVQANTAYLDNFGDPPYETKGRAYARVGYLPLRKNSNLVRAIPLFLFTDQNQLGHILETLTSGQLSLSAESDLQDSFAKNIDISVRSLEGGLLVLDLASTNAWSAIDLQPVVKALTETAVQFSDVTYVRFLLDGRPMTNMPEKGFEHNPEDVAVVTKPTLVDIAGTWHNDEEDLEEISVRFDRPITVNRFALYDNTGKKVEGEYFTSVLQMAVVIHPDNPKRFKEGSELQAEWDIVDALGRTNKGTTRLPLKHIEH
ncbi:MAG: hypothetical protein C0619_04515 [Desulfuromonas sp.]|nr:MAG: hypothetical protein C0619_04515 [Desulfuromonas sp.]